jgi:hypothetical protein
MAHSPGQLAHHFQHAGFVVDNDNFSHGKIKE